MGKCGRGILDIEGLGAGAGAGVVVVVLSEAIGRGVVTIE